MHFLIEMNFAQFEIFKIFPPPKVRKFQNRHQIDHLLHFSKLAVSVLVFACGSEYKKTHTGERNMLAMSTHANYAMKTASMC